MTRTVKATGARSLSPGHKRSEGYPVKSPLLRRLTRAAIRRFGWRAALRFEPRSHRERDNVMNKPRLVTALLVIGGAGSCLVPGRYAHRVHVQERHSSR
jgi:hypothetical protein